MNMKKENKNMLLRFVVKNYKSFRDEAVLDLTASSIKDNEGTLLEQNGVRVLPVIGIYGANASGKSNLIKAFKLLCSSVQSLSSSTKDMVAEPYVFSEQSKDEPSEFEVSFSMNDKEYRYGFEKKQEEYNAEWLFVKNFRKNTKSVEQLVFYREGKLFKSDLKNVKELTEIKFVHSMITSKELMLTLLGKRKKSKFADVFHWFMIHSEIIDYSTDSAEKTRLNLVPEFLYTHEAVRADVAKMIMEFDPCITDIVPEKEDDSDNYVLFTKHLSDDRKEHKFRIENESSGTRKLVSLAIDIVLSTHCSFPLFIDEFDAKLHPLIIRRLIGMYNAQSSRGDSCGQLVFTAHNLICMDSKDLRRDEVWFVEKNHQASELYSLCDFNTNSESVRADLSFGKNYLAGRFGAVPFQEEVNG